jgi:hypothetical protein
MPQDAAAVLVTLARPAKVGGSVQDPVAVAWTQLDGTDSQEPVASRPVTWNAYVVPPETAVSLNGEAATPGPTTAKDPGEAQVPGAR